VSATLTLFNRWKAAKGCGSSREALRLLGLSSGAAVHWNGGRNAAAHIIEKLAADLGEDPGHWVALAESERAQTEADRKTWAKLARRLEAAAPVTAIALAFVTLLPLSNQWLGMPIM
jgi:predicted Zn-dependent protease